jgi:hypothetical protein
LAASASKYNSNVGGPETQAKPMIYEDPVKSVVKNLKAKIAQQVYIIGDCKFLVNAQILNWTNKTFSREELLLEVWAQRRSLLRRAHLIN